MVGSQYTTGFWFQNKISPINYILLSHWEGGINENKNKNVFTWMVEENKIGTNFVEVFFYRNKIDM